MITSIKSHAISYFILVVLSGFSTYGGLATYMPESNIIDHFSLDRNGDLLVLTNSKVIQKDYKDAPPARLILSGYSEPDAACQANARYNLFKFIPKPWDEKK